MPFVCAATVVPIAIAMVVAILGFVALLPLLAVSVPTMIGNREVAEIPQRVPVRAPDVPPESATPPAPATAALPRPVEPAVGSVTDRDLAAGRGRSIRIALAATVLVAALVPVVAPTRKGRSRGTRPGQATGDSE